jgi:hypothetical protein
MVGFDWLAAGKLAIGALSGSSVKVSQAGADTVSGVGIFTGENNIKKRKPLIEFDNPLHVALTAAGVVAAVYFYKKYKG